MDKAILAPAAVLVLWTIVMLIGILFMRFPAIAKSGMDMTNIAPGGRGQDLQGVLPDRVMWFSHNYTHLHEQPTIFYATILILTLAGEGGGINTMLAWAYVGLRIAHSIWQATVNTIIPVRFALFALSTACLFIMAINAVRATLGV